MKRQDQSWEYLLDLFIRARAGGYTNDIITIEYPSSEMGGDDEWMMLAVSEHVNKLSNNELLNLIEEVINKTKTKYINFFDDPYPAWYLAYKNVEEILFFKSPKLNFNEQEEKRLIRIMLDLKEKMSRTDKYLIDGLLKRITGKNPEEYGGTTTLTLKYWHSEMCFCLISYSMDKIVNIAKEKILEVGKNYFTSVKEHAHSIHARNEYSSGIFFFNKKNKDSVDRIEFWISIEEKLSRKKLHESSVTMLSIAQDLNLSLIHRDSETLLKTTEEIVKFIMKSESWKIQHDDFIPTR